MHGSEYNWGPRPPGDPGQGMPTYTGAVDPDGPYAAHSSGATPPGPLSDLPPKPNAGTQAVWTLCALIAWSIMWGALAGILSGELAQALGVGVLAFAASSFIFGIIGLWIYLVRRGTSWAVHKYPHIYRTGKDARAVRRR